MPYDDNFFVGEGIEEDDVNDDAHVLQQHNDGEDDNNDDKEIQVEIIKNSNDEISKDEKMEQIQQRQQFTSHHNVIG